MPKKLAPRKAHQADVRVDGPAARRMLDVKVRDGDGRLTWHNDGMLSAMWPAFDPQDLEGLRESMQDLVFSGDLERGDKITLHVAPPGGIARAIRAWTVGADRGVNKGRALK